MLLPGIDFSFLGSQSAHWLLILATASLGSLFLFGLLRYLFGEHLNTLEILILALAGWPVLWVFSVVLGFLLNRSLNLGPLLAVFVFVLCGLVIVSGWKKVASSHRMLFWVIALPLLVFLLSFLTRLAFIKDLVVPSYFDGALHYSITQGLLEDFTRFPWQNAALPLHGYYHIGFHLLAAVFGASLKFSTNAVLLGLGAVFLAALPFPVFFVILRETDSFPAAIFAFLLAGWGWSMPVHALDWGKFPAVASLLTLQVALALALLFAHQVFPKHIKIFLAGLFLITAILSASLHSRSLVVIALVISSYLIARLWNDRVNRTIRFSMLAVLVLALTFLCVYLQSRDVLKLVFDSYVKNVWWLTLSIALLTPFAFKRSATWAFTSLLTGFLLLLSMLIPISTEPYQTLLDRPFVQMSLYLPLTWLGGLGLAGLLEMVRSSYKVWIAVMAVVFSALFVHIALAYNFSPSSCCIILGRDDAVAIDWLNQDATQDANILIAATPLDVFDAKGVAEGDRGTDAGIWIAPLIGRKITMLTFRTDFSAPEIQSSLCAQGISHIYVGGTGESFNLDKLRSRPAWYREMLSLPGAKVFLMLGCGTTIR